MYENSWNWAWSQVIVNADLNFRVRVFLRSAVIPSKKNQSVLIAKISSRKTQKIANPQK